MTMGSDVVPEPDAPSLHPLKARRDPEERGKVAGAIALTMSPAKYHPLPLTTPYWDCTSKKYCVPKIAIAVLGPSIKIMSHVVPLPVASPPQPLNWSRAPGPTGSTGV